MSAMQGTCSRKCAGCHLSGKTGRGEDGPGGLAGWRLVMWSALVFLLPLAGAAAGATWLRASGPGQFAGALGGFGLTVGLVMVIERLFFGSKVHG